MSILSVGTLLWRRYLDSSTFSVGNVLLRFFVVAVAHHARPEARVSVPPTLGRVASSLKFQREIGVPLPGRWRRASRYLVHLPAFPRQAFHDDTHRTGPSGLPPAVNVLLVAARSRAPTAGHRGTAVPLSRHRSLTGRCSGLACARR